jgi:hypothetical protein
MWAGESAARHLARLCAEGRADVAAGRLDQTRSQVALHEAGHAVVALAAGLPVHEVVLRETGGGHCTVAAGPLGAAAVLWAGGIAAGRLIGASRDLEQIRALNPLWLRATGPDTPFWLARGVLAEQWAGVELLAVELSARGRLDGAEVSALLVG